MSLFFILAHICTNVKWGEDLYTERIVSLYLQTFLLNHRNFSNITNNTDILMLRSQITISDLNLVILSGYTREQESVCNYLQDCSLA